MQGNHPKSPTPPPAYTPKFESSWKTTYDGIHNYVIQSYEKSTTERDVPHKKSIHMEAGAYWDNYFNVAGVLIDDTDPSFFRMAKEATENLLFIVDKLGFVPNVYHCDWGENRSQPPVLSMMVRDVYERMPVKDKVWLAAAYKTLRGEYRFWTDLPPSAIEDHTAGVPGLLKYFYHDANDYQKEDLLKLLKERCGITYKTEEERELILKHYFSEAASGMDFTTRYEERCADFASVDLVCYLYQYEVDFAFFVKELGFFGEPDWLSLAAQRKKVINEYLWNEERGLFLDYDYVNKRHSKTASVVSFIPLYLGIATPEQARRTVENLGLLECEWGLSNVEYSPEAEKYQWGWPMGWGVGHFWAFIGLYNYGFKEDLDRLCKKWLDVCARNYVKPEPAEREMHRLHEKYDVKTGGIAIREYGCWVYLSFTLAPFNWAYRYVTEGRPNYWEGRRV